MEKKTLIRELKSIIQERIVSTNADLQGLIESRDGDTKSSAGDKYETSREMIQSEIERTHLHWEKLRQQLNQLQQMDVSSNYTTCAPGALIELDDQWILLGPSLGKVKIEGLLLLSISMASPIGQLLNGRKAGDEIVFQKKNKKINQVL
ncbi:MAG: hypothetical protein ACQERC_11855 [Bacteroidota bacterium]